MSRPINPTTDEDKAGQYFIFANAGDEFAIYLKDGEDTIGRLFVTAEEMTDLTNYFIKTSVKQELGSAAVSMDSIKYVIDNPEE